MNKSPNYHISLDQEIKDHMDSLYIERLFRLKGCHKKYKTPRVGKLNHLGDGWRHSR